MLEISLTSDKDVPGIICGAGRLPGLVVGQPVDAWLSYSTLVNPSHIITDRGVRLFLCSHLTRGTKIGLAVFIPMRPTRK